MVPVGSSWERGGRGEGEEEEEEGEEVELKGVGEGSGGVDEGNIGAGQEEHCVARGNLVEFGEEKKGHIQGEGDGEKH